MRNNNVDLTIVSIHATILAIFIGLFSAYIFYQKSVITQFEIETIKNAEFINELEFSENGYDPDQTYIHEFDIDLLDNSDESREKIADMLFKVLHVTSGFDLDSNGEFILKMFNLITSRYPFPEKFYFNDDYQWVWKRKTENIHFKNIDDVSQWLEDLQVITGITRSTYFARRHYEVPGMLPSGITIFLEENEYNPWEKPEYMKELRKHFSELEIEFKFRQLDARGITENFFTNLDKLRDYIHDIESQIIGIKIYEANSIGSIWLKIGLFGAILSFIGSVAFPLLFGFKLRICTVWFPFMYYTSSLIYVVKIVFV